MKENLALCVVCIATLADEHELTSLRWNWPEQAGERRKSMGYA